MLGSLLPEALTLVVVAAGFGALMAMWPPLRKAAHATMGWGWGVLGLGLIAASIYLRLVNRALQPDDFATLVGLLAAVCFGCGVLAWWRGLTTRGHRPSLGRRGR
jgi:hypothetical protein